MGGNTPRLLPARSGVQLRRSGCPNDPKSCESKGHCDRRQRDAKTSVYDGKKKEKPPVEHVPNESWRSGCTEEANRTRHPLERARRAKVRVSFPCWLERKGSVLILGSDIPVRRKA
ncbi:hypothetical protein MTO96_023134 [Rhipicephalus appendiculatus]